MIYTVIVGPRARRDLEAIGAWVASQAGDRIADGYVNRIELRIQGLQDFPERGSLQPRMGEGVRSWGFEKRLSILYRVSGSRVRILRVVSAFRDTSTLGV